MSNNIFLLTENFNLGFSTYLIDVYLYISIICGIFVIISKNPIISVLFLIALFLNISSYIMLIGMYFIGLSYLLVYVGAVSILFLFILMLINIRISELSTNTSNGLPLSILIGIYFGLPIYTILPYTLYSDDNILITIKEKLNKILNNSGTGTNGEIVTIDNLSIVSSKFWDGNLAENSHISTIGNVMYSTYSMWLIITSLILLLAMVGAIIITIKQEK